ncbi:MAG: hypothetical protein ACE5J2_07125 [Nitrososphaerales archaeon]
MVYIPVLISREMEITGLKNVMVILVVFASLTLALTVYIYMHHALHLIVLPMTGFNIAHIWLYSILGGISIVLCMIAIYSNKVHSLRMPSGRTSPAFFIMLLGLLITVILLGMNEMLEAWFATEMVPTLKFLYFSTGLVPMMVGMLSYILRVHSRLVELGAETPPKKSYVAELYAQELQR